MQRNSDTEYNDLSIYNNGFVSDPINFVTNIYLYIQIQQQTCSCSIIDCLQRFVEVENLDETEWYTCNNCKKRQPSTKKFWILQLPNVIRCLITITIITIK